MRNGYREFYEVATADRARDGKSAVRADLERGRRIEQQAVRFVEEAARSRARRAAHARREHESREVRALIAAAELRLEAPLTPMGQFLAAARRERW